MPQPHMNQLRELEFELLVAGLLSAHPDYSYIRTEPRISRSLRPDLTAVRQRDRMTERLVIEAKNYKDSITKTQALQVANYLKPHGAGTLAIVAARKGANRSCMEVIREQWSTYGKLMVPVTGDDIEAMLRTKGVGGNPEELLVTIIREFRLSM